MSLTIGSGPFGHHPAGRFNFDAPGESVLYLEELPRWTRARLDGETVVDSRRPRLLHEHGRLPVLWFPEEDVRMDLVGELAARREEPLLEGLVSFEWEAMDEWLEEDEVQIGHVRDPYHRIDVRRTSRHVVVKVGDETVADTRRARVLFETGLPPRWYIPPEDVRMDLLEESDSSSVCAYKGTASYWSMGDEDDIVWTYRDPETEVLPIKDHLAFYNERAEIEVDGEVEGKPRTQWSRD